MNEYGKNLQKLSYDFIKESFIFNQNDIMKNLIDLSLPSFFLASLLQTTPNVGIDRSRLHATREGRRRILVPTSRVSPASEVTSQITDANRREIKLLILTAD